MQELGASLEIRIQTGHALPGHLGTLLHWNNFAIYHSVAEGLNINAAPTTIELAYHSSKSWRTARDTHTNGTRDGLDISELSSIQTTSQHKVDSTAFEKNQQSITSWRIARDTHTNHAYVYRDVFALFANCHVSISLQNEYFEKIVIRCWRTWNWRKKNTHKSNLFLFFCFFIFKFFVYFLIASFFCLIKQR